MTDPTTQAYAELQQAFEHYNRHLFQGQIPRCLITMQREKRTYGYYSRRRFVRRGDSSTMIDEIAINPSYFGVVPLIEILQTLVHEMAHAWQEHHGKPGRRAYHNKEWADKMESIGLMPSTTGRPGGARTGEKMNDYPIEGGAFMQATETLLHSGFQVSWIDRFPPVRPRTDHCTSISANIAEAVKSALTPVFADSVGTDPSDEESPTNDDIAASYQDASPVLPPLTPVNRSNRLKYRCPCCLSQVWGKPGLNIMCGESDCSSAVYEPVA